jgi:Fe-S cluster assembly protein SufD
MTATTSLVIPTGREEAWRFTPMKRLRGLQDLSAPAGGQISTVIDLAPEFSIEQVAAADSRVAPQSVTADFIAAAAIEFAQEVTFISLKPNAVASRPSFITLEGKGGDAATYARTVIELGNHAEATLVLRHHGEALLADDLEIRLGDGARLTLVSIQQWDEKSVHISRHHALIGKDAFFKSVIITLGGDVVRMSPSVDYQGPGGDVEMYGLYFADTQQHLEHRLHVHHRVPRCRSRVTYKGALQGAKARTVWIGDVAIRPEAIGTDTYELNRNLILTDGAQADSVPNLEIETGEIEGAGHASATGRFDDEQLFYLQARGIPEETARRLVVRGFFAELVAQIGIPELEEELNLAIDRELSGAGA